MTARETIEAELESQSGDFRDVIPLKQVENFRFWWRKKPEMRKLIREASFLRGVEASKSKVVRGLWELSNTREWKEDALQYFPFSAEFARIDERRNDAIP